MKARTTVCTLTASLWIAFAAELSAQGTAFTYQGRLNDTNGALNDNVAMVFRLYVNATIPIPLWQETHSSVPVSNGLFSVILGRTTPADETIFSGAPRWLGISVNGNPELTPRTQITATPYAITAGHLTGTVPSAGLSGTYSAPVTFSNAANSFTGNGGGLTNVNATTLSGLGASNFWQTAGNANTTAGTHFLGTRDNQPLDLRVNNIRVARFEPGANVTLGNSANQINAGVVGSTIAGGRFNTNGAGDSIIGGGRNNRIESAAGLSFIGGGVANAIETSADQSVIGGGNAGTIQTGARESFLGGGFANMIGTGGIVSFIGSGVHNTNWGYASFIGGGQENTIESGAANSAIGGGTDNTINTNAQYATIPGGRNNSATNYAFSAGRRAKAVHQGAFVWADSQNADFPSTEADQFAVRARGGVRFVTGGGGLSIDEEPVLSGSSLSTTFWKTEGNSGTSPGPHFLGTTDDQPLELKVNGLRALRLEPAGDSGDPGILPDGAPNVIGGAPNNFVAAGVAGATIAGGGATNYQFRYPEDIDIYSSAPSNSIFADFSTIGGGNNNRIASNYWGYSTIAGGRSNEIGTNSHNGAIGGGVANRIAAGSYSATIAGGYFNSISMNSEDSIIGGGYDNDIGTNSPASVIPGGGNNEIRANARNSTIAGGEFNDIGTNSTRSTISGGGNNDIGAHSGSSSIAGGAYNDIGTYSPDSTIGGGIFNTIGTNSSVSAIGGGGGNTIEANAQYATVSGGADNHVSVDASYAAVGGGRENTIGADAPYASIPGGRFAKANVYGQVAHANGRFSENGDAQTSTYVLRRTTTSATSLEMFLDGIGRRMEVPRNSSWMFDMLVVARATTPGGSDTFSAGWHIQGLIDNDGGNTHMEMDPLIVGFGNDNRPWLALPVADNGNDALVIFVQGDPSTTIRWVATVRTVEVIH